MTGLGILNLITVVGLFIVIRLRPRCTRCHGRFWVRRLPVAILTADGSRVAAFTCDVCALSGHPTNFVSKKGEEALRRDEEWFESMKVKE